MNNLFGFFNVVDLHVAEEGHFAKPLINELNPKNKTQNKTSPIQFNKGGVFLGTKVLRGGLHYRSDQTSLFWDVGFLPILMLNDDLSVNPG
jgi:hypothetical protein